MVAALGASGAFAHSQQPISRIAQPTSLQRTTASRGCYSRAPPFSIWACGLASLQGPREGAGHAERAQGPEAWGRGGEGREEREEREGEAGEGVQRHREGEKGQGGAGSCSRPQPAVTTASREQNQTQSGGPERTR